MRGKGADHRGDNLAMAESEHQSIRALIPAEMANNDTELHGGVDEGEEQEAQGEARCDTNKGILLPAVVYSSELPPCVVEVMYGA